MGLGCRVPRGSICTTSCGIGFWGLGFRVLEFIVYPKGIFAAIGCIFYFQALNPKPCTLNSKPFVLVRAADVHALPLRADRTLPAVLAAHVLGLRFRV